MAEADPSAEAWRRLAERAAGASLESLRSVSHEGIGLAPLYQRLLSDPPQPWRRERTWSVAQRLDHPDAAMAHRLALADLEGGADTLVIVGPASPYARGFGLDGDLDLALADIELDLISLRLDAGPDAAGLLAALAGIIARRRLTSAALDVDIAYDPIGCRARLAGDLADDTARILDLRAGAGLAGTVFSADGRPWHEAGAGEAQELAAVLATAVAYLRRLEAHDIAPDEGRGLIAVLLAVDADVLLGLAKMRGMRRLWARVATACGLTPAPLRVHAETSWRMMTRYDPWTNVMRTTTAAFVAGLGGADVVTVLPFTLPLGLPDDGARRLARNAQHVLLDEAHLSEVADPTAGAGAFEALTETLCREAWRLFQEIESKGGLPGAIPWLATKIAETARRRADDIATLTRGIVGTSRFASLDATLPSVLDAKLRPLSDAGTALPSRRDAEPFEALRDRAEALAVEGRRPIVFLATLGAPAAFGPPATEASNLFAVAGLRAEPCLHERDAMALLSDFTASGTRIACLCGTDTAYAGNAAPLVKGLREAGARRVLLVGTRDHCLQAHVDATIHKGCDALAILSDVLDIACCSAR